MCNHHIRLGAFVSQVVPEVVRVLILYSINDHTGVLLVSALRVNTVAAVILAIRELSFASLA